MKTSPALFVFALALVLSGCASRRVTYVRPPIEPVPAYKENVDWKPVAPQDTEVRGNWWEMFGDPQLDALEAQVSISNETLKAVEARFTQARALVRVSRAALFPQVGATPAITGVQASGNRAIPAPRDSYSDFLLPASASYEADVWGRVRGSIQVARTLVQASAGDIESIRLSLHAELAVDGPLATCRCGSCDLEMLQGDRLILRAVELA